MGNRTSIGNMASEIMKLLEDYSGATAEGVKVAVSDAGKTVKKEIKANAPTGTGTYSKNWSVKKVKESSTSLEVTVYSPKRYWQAHLLEFGHALRQGGRARAFPHIADAEETGIRQLEQDIERCIRDG